MTPDNDLDRIAALRAAVPAGGLFAGKDWRWSPRPFPLSPRTLRRIEALGPALARFQQAANRLYYRSLKGSLPGWIAETLDRGKPADLLAAAQRPGLRESLPRVIRPDLILTDTGFALTELDSVPGGIGLTAWLGQSHSAIGGAEVIGGPRGMIEGFQSILPGKNGADIVVSEESGDYRPEMEWLAPQLAGDWRVADAAGYRPRGRDVYRFFELFDLPNLPGLLDCSAAPGLEVTSPFKPWLEEKAWSALFWMRPLREIWRRELRDSHWRRLSEIIPYTWLVNPEALPAHAVIPRLEIQDFAELKSLSQSARDLVLKISGFSELAWGARSVAIGSDLSQPEWAGAVDRALASWDHSPWILQPFHKGKLVHHPYWDKTTGRIEMMEGRARLCPYYFVDAGKKREYPRLGGVLATICPADKKILHGMRDAILVPCAVDPDGF